MIHKGFYQGVGESHVVEAQDGSVVIYTLRSMERSALQGLGIFMARTLCSTEYIAQDFNNRFALRMPYSSIFSVTDMPRIVASSKLHVHGHLQSLSRDELLVIALAGVALSTAISE